MIIFSKIYLFRYLCQISSIYVIISLQENLPQIGLPQRVIFIVEAIEPFEDAGVRLSRKLSNRQLIQRKVSAPERSRSRD